MRASDWLLREVVPKTYTVLLYCLSIGMQRSIIQCERRRGHRDSARGTNLRSVSPQDGTTGRRKLLPTPSEQHNRGLVANIDK